MSKDEFEKVQEIVADGIAAAGLEEIVLSDEESAAKRLADAVSDEAVDRMIADAKETGTSLLDGPGGIIGQLTARIIERSLGAEMDTHLGYGKGDPAGRGSGNSRNGHYGKTVTTSAGPVRVSVPRDRNGAFEPQIVKKGQRRAGPVDEIILSLYARGLTTRDIQAHLAEVYGASVSPALVSNITDVVQDEIVTWQTRPLDAFYAIIYTGALVVKVRDGGMVQNKAAYLAVGVDADGFKHVLGLWLGGDEGSSFWAGVLAELRNRGVRDVLFVCCDGLKGLPEAVRSTWKDATVQTCVIHLIRSSMKYVSWKDRKRAAALMRPVYTQCHLACFDPGLPGVSCGRSALVRAMIAGCGQTVSVEGARLSDQVDLGVLATVVPRDAVDEAVAATGKAERRRGGKMPPQVTTYFVMGLALWDGDYGEVWRKLTGILAKWGCYGRDQAKITAGGITQARQRLGEEPVKEVFAQVAKPVATLDTPGAFLGPWRLVSQDGLEFDLPDTEANARAFGYPGTKKGAPRAAFPKARAVTVIETGSQAELLAAIGPCTSKGSGEQSLARELLPRLQPDWLLLCGRLFCSWKDWCTADGTGAALLWRVKAGLNLVPLEFHPDGSYKSVLVSPHVRGKAREEILKAARAGEELPKDKARYVRAVGYEIAGREKDGKEDELIALITNILDYRGAPAMALAEAYHQRREHETSDKQLKTVLRGPAAILRSQSPELVKQEIWGYFLTHYAVSALICRAATAAGIDPDRVKFTRTLRIVRDQARSLAFPP